MQYILITTNAKNTKPKQVKFDGRDYLVADGVLVVPGVMEGSEGAIFYDEADLQESVDQWNGMPLIYNHAYVEDIPVSGRTPEVLETQGLGFISDTHFEQSLKSKLWFDVVKLKEMDSSLFTKVKMGKPIELSVGLQADKELLLNEQTHNGKSYQKKAKRIKPDHVAVLPHLTGACGVKDGCGVNVNCSSSPTTNEEGIFQRFLSFLQKGLNLTPSPQSKKLDLTVNELSHDDIRWKLSAALRSTMTQDMPYCHILEVYDDYFIFEMGYEKSYRQDYKVVEDEVVLKKTPVEVKRTVEYVVNQQNPNPDSNPKEEPMALSAEDRKKKVQFIIANASSWKRPGDDVILNSVPDEKLLDLEKDAQKEVQAAALNKAAQTGFTEEQVNQLAELIKVKLSPVTGSTTPPPANFAGIPGVPAVGIAPTVPNAVPLTVNEWMATAPPEVRQAVQYNLDAVQREKDQIIQDMIVNEQNPEARKAHITRLSQRSIEDLRYLHQLMPRRVSYTDQPTYIGAAGGMVVNAQNDGPDQDDFLPTTESHRDGLK